MTNIELAFLLLSILFTVFIGLWAFRSHLAAWERHRALLRQMASIRVLCIQVGVGPELKRFESAARVIWDAQGLSLATRVAMLAGFLHRDRRMLAQMGLDMREVALQDFYEHAAIQAERTAKALKP